MESCKKGVLKVDLQALTVGVAVLSMAAWLSGARDALIHNAQPALDASRKLAIVNGLGEHSRAQVHVFACNAKSIRSGFYAGHESGASRCAHLLIGFCLAGMIPYEGSFLPKQSSC